MPIYIKNIYLYPLVSTFAYGEARSRSAYKGKFKFDEKSNVDRLIAHIKILAKVTDQYHEYFYCEQKGEESFSQIKECCLNHITRLLLPEFSLYTCKPLTLSEFSQLRERILDIAKNQHENVHLLLSSFAVKNSDTKIFNFSLYIQCGLDAKIHIFCKASAANEDIQYLDHDLYSQTEYSSDSKSDYVSGDDIMLKCGFFETITTAGGLKYSQAIEICLDHAITFAKKQVEREIKSDSNILIPELADHVVSSNSINILKEAVITQSDAIQIDPDDRPVFPHRDKVKRSFELKLDPFACYSTKIDKALNGIILRDSPFGPDSIFRVTEEKKLGHFCNDLQKKIQEHNARVFKRRYTPQYVLDAEKEQRMLESQKLILILSQQVSLYQSYHFWEKAKKSNLFAQISKNVFELQQLYMSEQEEIIKLLIKREQVHRGLIKFIFSLSLIDKETRVTWQQNLQFKLKDLNNIKRYAK